MKTDRRIIYLISGKAHLPYLVASLFTLRQHWDGEIGIYVWPESHDLVQKISQDPRLNVTLVEQREPPYRRCKAIRSNAQFLHKIRVAQSLRDEVETVLYIDADTTIHGNLDSLFVFGKQFGFCATQWNDWISTGTRVSGRIRKLREVPEVDQRAVDSLLACTWPSVNGGVWAARPESPVLETWFNWALAACPMFIADERALHALLPVYVPQEMMYVLSGEPAGMYNSCPKLNKKMPLEKMLVRHFHGDSCCRPEKSQIGYSLWWPIYQKCLKENVGGMADWRKDIRNKHLNRIDGFVK